MSINIIMLLYLFHFFIYFFIYTGLDYVIADKVQGKYYLIHFFNNMYLVYLTMGDVIFTWTNFFNFLEYPSNYESAVLTFALHFYHIFSYFPKLRFDDWLHHILMIFVALPIAIAGRSGSLLGHSLFFLTGLPGGLDYLLLFLVRNGWMNSITEKRINNYINLWIRAPGCIAHSTLTIVSYFAFRHLFSWYDMFTCFTTSLIIFWNGIYFMNQVVVNHTLVTNKLIDKKN